MNPHQRWLALLCGLGIACCLVLVGCSTAQATPSSATAIPSLVQDQHDKGSPADSGQATPPTATLKSAIEATAPALPDPQPRDPYGLAAGLRGVPTPVARTIISPPPTLGDQATFWVSDLNANQTARPISATLRYITPHLYMWVQDGEIVDQQKLAASAERFERQIYPTNRVHFGSEWTPGVDGDPHLVVLNAVFDGAAGYYSSADQYPRAVNPQSNQREMFYINLCYKQPGSDDYVETLAHEFQHMIHWHADPNEDAWVNEGASQVAEWLNGFAARHTAAFDAHPDHQLTTWPDSDTAPHYDASFLWTAYFYERFGREALRQVVQHPANGMAGYGAVLDQLDADGGADMLFADWVIANYVDDPTLADGRYGYRGLERRHVAGIPIRTYPQHLTETVQPHGTDYVELFLDHGDLTLTLTGTVTAPLIAELPVDGHYLWWSNRADNSATSLSRAVDLRGVGQATLVYDLWYDIEPGWDHGYVQVSLDDGATWASLAGQYTTTANPYGQSYGPAYTGRSGGGTAATWVREEIDLRPYVGQQVLLRFLMLTDDAVNRPGLCLDNLRIDEIGFHDNVERADGAWLANGFARTDNQVGQRYLVQTITMGRETSVARAWLSGGEPHTWQITGFGDTIARAVVAVSCVTPYSTEPAPFALRARRNP